MTDSAAIAVVDSGSSSTKGAVVDVDGRHLAEASRPVGRRVDGDRVEHDPAAIAEGVEGVLEELVADHRVSAIALTCQRSTCLVWDRESGRPLTPARSWQDTAEADRVAALAEHGDEVRHRTGLPLSPHYAAPKLAALVESLDGGARRAAEGELVAGTLDAFLCRRLTGDDTTEPGHAGRSLLYGLEADDWDPWLCELFGVPAAALPELAPSAGERGRWRDTPLVALAGDQQAALVGHGGWEARLAIAHFGTGAFVLASTGPELLRHSGLLSAVLASTSGERRFQLEGSINSAGSAVDWACRLTGERLEAWGERELDPAALPWMLPAFAGVAAPWWRSRARAAVAGLTLDHGGEELLGGVLAGLAMRVVDVLEALAQAGVALESLRVSGKLTRLEGLVGLVADAGGLPVEVAAEEEAGIDGIARLARLASGAAHPEVAPAGRVREPRWPEARVAEAREGWRRFVERALELTDGSGPPG